MLAKLSGVALGGCVPTFSGAELNGVPRSARSWRSGQDVWQVPPHAQGETPRTVPGQRKVGGWGWGAEEGRRSQPGPQHERLCLSHVCPAVTRQTFPGGNCERAGPEHIQSVPRPTFRWLEGPVGKSSVPRLQTPATWPPRLSPRRAEWVTSFPLQPRGNTEPG